MHVKVYERTDGAVVVLPADLEHAFPRDYHGALAEVGDASLDLDCLSGEFVAALGMKGYCVATGDDVASILHCVTAWHGRVPAFASGS
ncbi:MAG: hypothetical protein EPO46_03195 [Lysobacter sp.]|nr:MAG: hypothetical protein EPO46_03195 [Lysobacter sp.]